MCAWNVAHPGLYIETNKQTNKRGSKIYLALEQRSSQLQKRFAQMSLRIREQPSTRVRLGWSTRAGLKMMQPIRLNWVPRRGGWEGLFWPDTLCARELYENLYVALSTNNYLV